MVFSRLFGKSSVAPPPPAPADADESDDGIDADGDAPIEEEHAEVDWLTRAQRVIPLGPSPGSKRPRTMFGDPEGMPTHFVQAAGCHVVTAEGDSLVDTT